MVKSNYTGTTGSFEGTGYINSSVNFDLVKILSVNYYDNYRFRSLPGFSDAAFNYTVPAGFTNTRYGDDNSDYHAKAMLTATKTAVLDNPGKFLCSVFYYDNKGRVIQTRSNNHLNGHDKIYNQYSFTGNVLKTLKEHSSYIVESPYYTPLNVKELYEYTYDHAGRLKTTHHQYDNYDKVLLSENHYDDLGRLVTKYRHNKTDTTDYRYNIRNWITNIKNGGFEQKLHYTSSPVSSQGYYNGNISAMTWKYKNQINGYQFHYDKLNRLTEAYSGKGENLSGGNSEYEEDFTYDKNGNIKTLLRNSVVGAVDMLAMHYNGNQLRQVDDEYGSSSRYGLKEYKGEAMPSGTRFLYNANGNLVTDLDREIVTIKYNLLNLPDTIQFKNGNQIINTYAADGRKLKTSSFTLMNPVVTPISQGNVLRNLKYECDVINEDIQLYHDNYDYNLTRDIDQDYAGLTRLKTPEGYIAGTTRVSGKWVSNYHYYRKDHLGNNREVWRAYNNTVTQRTQYYPSGLPYYESEGQSLQPYKYNDKEFMEMHGYDSYDYGARGLHSAKMRFDTMDPLAEKYYSVSPYAYCANNPIRYVDPDGRNYGDFYDMNGNRIGTDGINDKKKYIVLDKQESKQIEKTDKQGNTTNRSGVSSSIEKPSTSTMTAATTAINNTNATGNEHGFVVATDGSTSSIVTDNNSGSVQLAPAYNEVQTLGNTPAFDVHTHPNTVVINPDGTYTVSDPNPSGTPGDPNVYYDYGYRKLQETNNQITEPSWILGSKINSVTNGTPDRTPVVTFYRSTGVIGQVKWANFVKVVNKIK